jgi:hypothetical protein
LKNVIPSGRAPPGAGSGVYSVIIATAFCAGLACSEPRTQRGQNAADSSDLAQSVGPSARCYRSSHSVLLGPIAKSRQNARGPGWLRVEGIQAADSGAGDLVDATRAGLSGMWRRGPGDSVSMSAGDDFLRVELRLVISDSLAVGSAMALSDADLERDASGQLRTFRRGWVLRATRASCDSMPIRSVRGSP